jgi:hypothetical protein
VVGQLATLKADRTSTANTVATEESDASVDRLLAQAAYIMENPDEFVASEGSVEDDELAGLAG